MKSIKEKSSGANEGFWEGYKSGNINRMASSINAYVDEINLYSNRFIQDNKDQEKTSIIKDLADNLSNENKDIVVRLMTFSEGLFKYLRSTEKNKISGASEDYLKYISYSLTELASLINDRQFTETVIRLGEEVTKNK